MEDICLDPEKYVSKFYVMEPQHDDLVFGDALREGMIVLLEDSLMRQDMNYVTSGYDLERADEVNRWCVVLDLKVIPRDGSPLVRFVGEYEDGTKKVRTYDASFGWLVKKVSM